MQSAPEGRPAQAGLILPAFDLLKPCQRLGVDPAGYLFLVLADRGPVQLSDYPADDSHRRARQLRDLGQRMALPVLS